MHRNQLGVKFMNGKKMLKKIKQDKDRGEVEPLYLKAVDTEERADRIPTKIDVRIQVDEANSNVQGSQTCHLLPLQYCKYMIPDHSRYFYAIGYLS